MNTHLEKCVWSKKQMEQVSKRIGKMEQGMVTSIWGTADNNPWFAEVMDVSVGHSVFSL
jgi:hypothetical protein